MANSNKVLTGPHLTDGAEAGRLHSSRVYDEIYVAEIQQVSPESNSFSVQTRDGSGQISDLQMNFPGFGNSSFMGVMPEISSLVILLKLPGVDQYYVLGYLPPDPFGGRRYRLLEKWQKDQGGYYEELQRVVASRMRTMAPGDAYIAAKGGSEIYLDEDVEIHGQSGDEVRIRSSDHSVLATSRNNFMFANGVWRSAGPIQRNSLKTTDKMQPIDGLEAVKVTLSDNREVVYMVDALAYGTEVPVEYRLDVEDRVKFHQPLNDVNAEANISHRVPVASLVMANMVGNDEKSVGTYGQYLAPSFLGQSLTDAGLLFKPLSRTGSGNQLKDKGVAWGFDQPGLAFTGSDKEGVSHRFMGMSRGNSAGLSMETAAKGGRRDSWGKLRDTGLSWEAQFRGGIDWSVGKRDSNLTLGNQPYSLNLRMAGPAYIEYGPSSLGSETLNSIGDATAPLNAYEKGSYGRVERVQGNSRDEVAGKYELSVGGDIVWEIGGSFKYSLGGSFVDSSMGDRTINTTSAFSTNSLKIQNTSGSRTEKFVKGSDDKIVMLGGVSETLAAGSRTTTIAAGGIVETLAAGSRTTTIGAGSVTTTVGAGSISSTTGAGAISLSTVAGVVTFAGMLVSTTALTAIDLQAPIVGMGLLPTRSGIVTMQSHKCYITGLPPIPSLTCLAAM